MYSQDWTFGLGGFVSADRIACFVDPSQTAITMGFEVQFAEVCLHAG